MKSEASRQVEIRELQAANRSLLRRVYAEEAAEVQLAVAHKAHIEHRRRMKLAAVRVRRVSLYTKDTGLQGLMCL